MFLSNFICIRFQNGGPCESSPKTSPQRNTNKSNKVSPRKNTLDINKQEQNGPAMGNTMEKPRLHNFGPTPTTTGYQPRPRTLRYATPREETLPVGETFYSFSRNLETLYMLMYTISTNFIDIIYGEHLYGAMASFIVLVTNCVKCFTPLIHNFRKG